MKLFTCQLLFWKERGSKEGEGRGGKGNGRRGGREERQEGGRRGEEGRMKDDMMKKNKDESRISSRK